MNSSRLNAYIGDKAFYRRLMRIAMPVMLQNGITNFVSLLDNIMVGAVGTEQMTGVSIVGQLLFVFYLCIFGGLSGAGIFTSQYYGRSDLEGVRNTFRFKFWLGLFLFAAGTGIFLLWGDNLIALYLHDGGETGDIAVTADYGSKYLTMMLYGLLPFVIQQIYSTTLRETGETFMPMMAGIIAILVNLVFNYILIFGHFGAPAMGCVGAALATVLSRYVECLIVVIWSHRHPKRVPYIRGIYSRLSVPLNLTRQISLKSLPLLINEALWSSGMAAVTQCYSTFGLAVVAGLNIATTISNLFSVIWMAMGTAVSIIVGQQLGANAFEEAEASVRKIMLFSIVSSVAVAAVVILLAPLFPELYNTTEEVKRLAVGFLCISMAVSPVHAFANAAYFTLRSGGKTWITFAFDSLYLWVLRVPVVRALIAFTSLPIMAIFVISNMIDLVKCVLGYILLKRGTWVHNIVESI